MDVDLFVNIIPLFGARKLVASKINNCAKLESKKLIWFDSWRGTEALGQSRYSLALILSTTLL